MAARREEMFDFMGMGSDVRGMYTANAVDKN
jgi:hypothetical protein